jgi:competence protein ComFC
LIHRFKFERHIDLGKHLTTTAFDVLSDRINGSEYDSIIPIPMLKRDLRKRSFNQTESIARVISEKLNIALQTNILSKVKRTRLQANLGRDERWSNVKGAFAIGDETDLSNAHCLLVDDIVTTGATCLEAAKALYKAGADKITIFSLVSNHHGQPSRNNMQGNAYGGI